MINTSPHARGGGPTVTRMKDLPHVLGDVLLGGFAVVVLTGAVVSLRQSPAPSPSYQTAVSAPEPSPTELTGQSQGQAVTAAAPGTVLLAGPDLEGLKERLGIPAEVAPGPPLTVSGLGAVATPPTVAVLEIVAGARTSLRTTTAITALTLAWPSVHVYVVGPFGANDRKSAGAAKVAALAAGADFVDPVALGWRKNALTATLSKADQGVVTAKLAALLDATR